MGQQNGGILSKKIFLDCFMQNKKKELLMRKVWFIIGMVLLIFQSIGLGIAFPGALIGLPVAAALIILFVSKRKKKLRQASSDMQALLDRGDMSIHKYRIQYAAAWENGAYVCVSENEDGSRKLLTTSARPAFAAGKSIYFVKSPLFNQIFFCDSWTPDDEISSMIVEGNHLTGDFMKFSVEQLTDIFGEDTIRLIENGDCLLVAGRLKRKYSRSGHEDYDDITYYLDFGKAERFRKKYCEMTSYSLYRRVCEGDNALYVISKDGKLQNNKYLFINALFTDELRKLICPDPDVVGQ